MKDQIIRAFSMGESVDDIAMEFDMDIRNVEKIVNEYQNSIR